jgi:DNA topoisomerase-1
MRTAQQLYEGIDLGAGPVGLITYMRTDSVVLANEAVEEIRELIKQRYGKDSVPAKPPVYKTKSKNAQEAHEAVRPTSALLIPEEIKEHLTAEQYKLYDLIWKRTVASQMTHATLNTVSVELHCGNKDNIFRASGSSIKDAGFMAVYQEGADDKADDSGDERLLPVMEVGDEINLEEIRSEQHFTEPPPRFSEASLIKSLEEYGIGRPSTYASIISTIQNREYAEIESRRFFPTDIGRLVTRFLTKHFTQYVDYDFTARLEDELDEISRGEKDWVPVMEAFWNPFDELVKDKEVSVTREEAIEARDLGMHPKSGKPMSVRMGRYGPFVQIGTKDDEDKPKFAGLRPGQKMDSVTMEDALELFKLPRDLGETEDGEKIAASFGRFGPYVKFGTKYASIKGEDPHTITLEKALEFIAVKKEEDANKFINEFVEEGIQVLNGRYGPYVTDGKKNAKIPKDVEPESLTLEQCKEMIAKAPARKARRKTAKKKKSSK